MCTHVHIPSHTTMQTLIVKANKEMGKWESDKGTVGEEGGSGRKGFAAPFSFC